MDVKRSASSRRAGKVNEKVNNEKNSTSAICSASANLSASASVINFDRFIIANWINLFNHFKFKWFPEVTKDPGWWRGLVVAGFRSPYRCIPFDFVLTGFALPNTNQQTNEFVELPVNKEVKLAFRQFVLKNIQQILKTFLSSQFSNYKETKITLCRLPIFSLLVVLIWYITNSPQFERRTENTTRTCCTTL